MHFIVCRFFFINEIFKTYIVSFRIEVDKKKLVSSFNDETSKVQ